MASDSDDEDTDGGAIAEQDEDSDPSESDAKKVPAVKVQKGKDGEHYIEVGNKRRITVRSFKGTFPSFGRAYSYTDHYFLQVLHWWTFERSENLS